MRQFSFRLLLFLPMALLLVGCGASPAPYFIGAKRTEVVRDGRTYVLFQKEKRVEIIRLGYAHSGEHRGIRATMITLIPEITGCRLVAGSLRGDSGEMRGRVTRCHSRGRS
ncbi:hypothetical protein [Acidimangrovimonas sediminis]|uniref:hypothetical protein n=1 Tax=Acidimangrovimonas sediminis TaxID=2056283 RepID=UPI000C80F259|nr:hypothetical protein [Acidimangrovimonas sediminis]